MTKYRLLIVDDEELIRHGLRARIHSFGLDNLEIEMAGSGTEGLEKLKRGDVDIALVDISMPDMSGLELIERARELNLDVQFILLSGYAEFSYAQRAIQLRVRAYLNKPVSNEMLRGQLEAAISELSVEDRSVEDRQDRAAYDLEKELNFLLSGEIQKEKRADTCPGLCEFYPQLVAGTGKAYLAIVHLGVKNDDRGRLTNDSLNAIRPKVRSIFEEAACDCPYLIADSYQNPQRMYVLFMSENGKNLRLQVEKLFLSVHPELERSVNARVTMGVSRMTACPGADSVSDARTALRQRFVHGRSNIYFYEDVAEMKTQSFPEAELELLRRCMEREDREGAHRQLGRLLSEEQMESRRAVYLHVLWVRIVSMVMRMYDAMDSATMNRMIGQLSHMETMSYQDAIGSLTKLIDDCMKRHGGREMNTAEKISYATNYIREHFNEEIVINDLASKLDMSLSYFSSIFKKEVGQSTMQYITGLRIERAQQYLTDTDLSVAVIAQDVGYSDSQYFYRVFKKSTGMTPLQYRQEFRIE